MNKFTVLNNTARALLSVVIVNVIFCSLAQAVESDIALSKNASWQLVWSDEFEGKAIDAKKWSHVVDCYGGGNDEQQCYTNRKENSFVENGLLTIVAQREDHTGPAIVDGDMSNTRTLPYTSARLRTMNKGDWKYGRFEIRAKLPFGQGTWPAIWMLPTDYVYGGWASSGEIDIIEAANLKTPSGAADAKEGELESRIHGTLHFGEAWPKNVHSGMAYKFNQSMNPADDFHTYAIEWQEDEMRWYVDDIHYATQRKEGWYSRYMVDGELVTAKGSAPYDQNFHLILNLAVGGAWSSNANNKGIDQSIFPQTLQIDFVRVYQCNSANDKGEGCETIGSNATFVEGHKVVIPNKNFALGENFDLYKTGLTQALIFNHYDPIASIGYKEVESEREQTLYINQTGEKGNIAIQYPPRADLSRWLEKGTLEFDAKVISRNRNSKILVKMGSGWPKVSDVGIFIDEVGQWQHFRLNIAELINRGNSFYPDELITAEIDNILNMLVIEPTGPMELLIKNIALTN